MEYGRTILLLRVCMLITQQVTASKMLIEKEDCPVLEVACPTRGKDSWICDTTEECLIGLISDIPKSCMNLTITVDKLTETGITFSGFSNLTHLEILWKYELDDLLQADQNNLSSSSLLGGLEQLKHLKISIPVKDIHHELLLELPVLQSLDFTNLGFYSTAKFANLINGSLLAEKPLTHLTLNRISGVLPARDRVFLLKDFLPLLRSLPLTYIDMSHNNEIYVYPTVIQNLPFLREVKVRDVTPRYLDDLLDAQCTYIEGLLHQNITFIDLRGLGAIGTATDVFGLGFLKQAFTCIVLNANKTSNTCICQVYSATCGKYFQGGNFCSRLPEFNYRDLRRKQPLQIDNTRYCLNNIAYPFPKQWTSVRVGNSELIYHTHHWENKTLCFAPNNMTTIDVSYITFKQTVDSMFLIGWEKLEVFDMAYSTWGFYFHDPRFLHVFPNLKVLNLTGTCVGTYLRNDTKNQTFAHSHRLETLLLQNAKLTSFSFNTFSNLRKLELLDLSMNKLTDIEFNISRLLSLKKLNLSHNSLLQLGSIFTKTLSTWADLHTRKLKVDLQDNPLICDCKSLDFLRWIAHTSIDFESKDKYLCSYKGRHRITLSSVNTWNLRTDCNLTMILTVDLIGVFAIIIVMSATVFKYRWKIKTWVLKAAHSRNTKSPDHYIYDGFVVYADANREWIHNDMLDEIEQKRGLKICIHHRDFLPGENIHAQIAECIDNSRKTILILTKEFIKSEWCMFEMSVARNLLPAEGRDVVVPILLAELPTESMRPEVKCLIREKTYLAWETSVWGQEFFWNKLAVVMCGSTSKIQASNAEIMLNVEENTSRIDMDDETLITA